MIADLTGIRIVFVNNFPGPGLGGGEVQTLALVRGFLEAGASVRAVVPPGSGFGAEVAGTGATVAEVPMAGRNARAATRAIAAELDGDGAAVVVGTGYWTNLLVRHAARGVDARVVNLVGVTPGASVADGGSQLGLAARRLADRATASRVDAWVAVAGAVASALVAGGAPRERVHTIPNGIDIGALRAAAAHGAAPIATDGALVVCAARLEAVKGVEYLVRAAAQLPDATVAIAGDGPLAGRLRELAVALGVSDRVHFLGRVSPSAPLLAAADVVALPSLSEGLPIVALEAMALGRPVVATRVGGTAEAVEDGVTGLLVEACDPAALAGAIRRVLGDAKLAAAMGEAGAKRAEERFTSATMVEAYAALVAELVVAPPR